MKLDYLHGFGASLVHDYLSYYYSRLCHQFESVLTDSWSSLEFLEPSCCPVCTWDLQTMLCLNPVIVYYA